MVGIRNNILNFKPSILLHFTLFILFLEQFVCKTWQTSNGGNKQFINRCEDSLLIPIFFHWSKHVTTHISYINDNKDLDGQKGVEDYIRLQLVPYWLLRITTNIILHYTLPYYDVLKYNVTAQMIRLLELLGMLSITSHT